MNNWNEKKLIPSPKFWYVLRGSFGFVVFENRNWRIVDFSKYSLLLWDLILSGKDVFWLSKSSNHKLEEYFTMDLQKIWQIPISIGCLLRLTCAVFEFNEKFREIDLQLSIFIWRVFCFEKCSLILSGKDVKISWYNWNTIWRKVKKNSEDYSSKKCVFCINFFLQN